MRNFDFKNQRATIFRANKWLKGSKESCSWVAPNRDNPEYPWKVVKLDENGDYKTVSKHWSLESLILAYS